MFNLFKLATLVFSALYSLTSFAVSIEAIGKSQIVNGDLDRARTLAIERATEQASLFSMAQIATTQSIRDGILEIDNLRISTLSRVENLEVLSETVSGNQLTVHIRVDLEPQKGCADQSKATAYKKPIALFQWAIDHPSEANMGGLSGLGRELPLLLERQLERRDHLQLIDATGLRLPDFSASAQLDPSFSTQVSTLTEQLSTQYILTGRIQSLSMEQMRSDTENILLDNPAVEFVRQQGILPAKDLRYFNAEVDLLDASSGDLLQRYRLRTQGAWRMPLQQKVSDFQEFANQPYGNAIVGEMNKLADQLSDTLLCQPLTANIIRTSGRQVWIDRGANAGLNPGDRLSVSRKLQIYDGNMLPLTEIEQTDVTLRLDRVETNRAVGTLSDLAEVANIQTGDLVIGY